MTITRLYTLGFESNGSGSITELPNPLLGADSSISSVLAKTGTYAMRIGFAANSYPPYQFQPRDSFAWGGG
jgi:hypothetical protein